MANGDDARISLSARPVEATGAPFAPRSVVYHDVSVALDEILSLTGNVEPVVLRVSVSGGTAEDRASVGGDWLCADHEPPAPLPKPAWDWSDEARVWCSGREWIDAWELCDRAEWMMHAVGGKSLDAAIYVQAACACARTSLAFVPTGGGYSYVYSREHLSAPRAAIEAAESWARGRASGEAARRASWGADFLARELLSPWTAERSSIYYAARAASAAAMSAYYAAEEHTNRGGATVVECAANSYASARHASGDREELRRAHSSAYRRRLAELSSLIREKVPTVAVLRGVASAFATS